MAQDVIYYFDKQTRIRHLLGEVQKGFNMSFVIDGTKDSAKLQVISFEESEIEPNTIVLHQETQTWWIVSHDKVERYYHEINNVYKHNLELLGAIELLNARDLTDSGFNAKTYTLEQFIERLFSLSNFEFPLLSITPIKFSIDTSILVDYVKTFENYTLLSAIRELLDGYNCCPKLSFKTYKNSQNVTRITGSLLDIYSKVGKGIIDFQESYFSNVKETKTMDKNSFGTIVVSNAENVISTKAKTYPSSGNVKMNSNEYNIDGSNGIIRLPSNAYKVNWVKMYRSFLDYRISFANNLAVNLKYIPFNNSYNESEWNKVLEHAHSRLSTNDYNDLVSKKQMVFNSLFKMATTTLYNNDNYDPINNKFISLNNNEYYLPKVYKEDKSDNHILALSNKQTRDSIQYTDWSIYWERGKNIISGFDFMSSQYVYLGNFQDTDFRQNATSYTFASYTYDLIEPWKLQILLEPTSGFLSNRIKYSTTNTLFSVNYVPMTDLKIKYDNSGDSKDIQLYNQVGRLTDGVALSKLMLSYSKEIESDTITKYKADYDFSDMPKVGDAVSIGSNAYIINNISYDFYENESGDTEYDYYIVGEFTMSKWTSTKSLMTNPNTNIRDYGIPQNNNVARKQLYRDFYELAHTIDGNADSEYYMPFNKIFNFTNYYKELVEHIAVIKLEYNEEYGGDNDEIEPSDTWYYQLETTTYILKKEIYEVVNFNDNNIIGYDSQNVWTAFDIRRIFNGLTINKNTPISYVDPQGQVKSFYIAMCNINQLATIYDYYQQKMETEYSETYNGVLYNNSIFIPSEIYEGFTLSNYQSTSSISDKVLQPELDISHDESTYYLELENEGMIPDDFSGTDIVVDSITCVDSDDQSVSVTPHIVWLSTHGGWTLRFTLSGMLLGNMKVSATITTTYPKEISGAVDYNDFSIEEEDYNKDAIEVPVFEYSCQIDDTEEVIVGENILENQIGDKYAYSYYLVDKNTINENTFNSITLEKIHVDNDIVTNEEIAFWDKAVVFEYNSSEIKIALYGQCDKLNLENETTPSYSNRVSLTSSMFADKDLVIVRHTIPQYYTNEFVDPFYNLNTTNSLLFVVKNIGSSSIVDNKIVLKINHYTIS